MQSLNELRDWFMEGERNEDEDEGERDMNTPVTLSFSNGHTLTADLSLGWFDTEDDEGATRWRHHMGVELWITADVPAQDEDKGLWLNLMAPDDHPWTLPRVCAVFGIDPDAPIWRREE